MAAYQAWLLTKGHAVNWINVKVSTVKTYAKLAFKAGVLDHQAYALIKDVEGYSRCEQNMIDEKRKEAGLDIRIGDKKAGPVTLTNDQAERLKEQPETPQGRRDQLLMCLLLDHGLRVSEVALLKVEGFDLETGTFTFYRPKIDKTQTHELTTDAKQAARVYLTNDADNTGPLLKGSNNQAN